MMLALLANQASAKGLDFNHCVEHEFRLSSTRMSVFLPGGLDKDFPEAPGHYRSNIYDADSYDGIVHLPLLLERHWDYRGHFWQGSAGRFGMLGFTLQLRRIIDAKDINLLHDFEPVKGEITQDISEKYAELNQPIPGEPASNQVDINVALQISNLTLNGLQALRSKEVNDYPLDDSEIVVYHIPLSDQHYLNFRFKLTPLGDNNMDKWYSQALRDIDRIIQSVKFDYARGKSSKL